MRIYRRRSAFLGRSSVVCSLYAVSSIYRKGSPPFNINIVNANVIVATYFAEFRMQCNEIKNCQLLSKESAIFKVNM